MTQDKRTFAGHIHVKAIQTFSTFMVNQWTKNRWINSACRICHKGGHIYAPPHGRSAEHFMLVKSGEGEIHGQWVKKSEEPDCIPHEPSGCTHLGTGQGGWVGGAIMGTSGRLREKPKTQKGQALSLSQYWEWREENEMVVWHVDGNSGCRAALSASP